MIHFSSASSSSSSSFFLTVLQVHPFNILKLVVLLFIGLPFLVNVASFPVSDKENGEREPSQLKKKGLLYSSNLKNEETTSFPFDSIYIQQAEIATEFKSNLDLFKWNDIPNLVVAHSEFFMHIFPWLEDLDTQFQVAFSKQPVSSYYAFDSSSTMSMDHHPFKSKTHQYYLTDPMKGKRQLLNALVSAPIEPTPDLSSTASPTNFMEWDVVPKSHYWQEVRNDQTNEKEHHSFIFLNLTAFFKWKHHHYFQLRLFSKQQQAYFYFIAKFMADPFLGNIDPSPIQFKVAHTFFHSIHINKKAFHPNDKFIKPSTIQIRQKDSVLLRFDFQLHAWFQDDLVCEATITQEKLSWFTNDFTGQYFTSSKTRRHPPEYPRFVVFRTTLQAPSSSSSSSPLVSSSALSGSESSDPSEPVNPSSSSPSLRSYTVFSNLNALLSFTSEQRQVWFKLYFICQANQTQTLFMVPFQLEIDRSEQEDPKPFIEKSDRSNIASFFTTVKILPDQTVKKMPEKRFLYGSSSSSKDVKLDVIDRMLYTPNFDIFKTYIYAQTMANELDLIVSELTVNKEKFSLHSNWWLQESFSPEMNVYFDPEQNTLIPFQIETRYNAPFLLHVQVLLLPKKHTLYQTTQVHDLPLMSPCLLVPITQRCTFASQINPFSIFKALEEPRDLMDYTLQLRFSISQPAIVRPWNVLVHPCFQNPNPPMVPTPAELGVFNKVYFMGQPLMDTELVDHCEESDIVDLFLYFNATLEMAFELDPSQPFPLHSIELQLSLPMTMSLFHLKDLKVSSSAEDLSLTPLKKKYVVQTKLTQEAMKTITFGLLNHQVWHLTLKYLASTKLLSSLQPPFHATPSPSSPSPPPPPGFSSLFPGQRRINEPQENPLFIEKCIRVRVHTPSYLFFVPLPTLKEASMIWETKKVGWQEELRVYQRQTLNLFQSIHAFTKTMTSFTSSIYQSKLKSRTQQVPSGSGSSNSHTLLDGFHFFPLPSSFFTMYLTMEVYIQFQRSLSILLYAWRQLPEFQLQHDTFSEEYQVWKFDTKALSWLTSMSYTNPPQGTTSFKPMSSSSSSSSRSLTFFFQPMNEVDSTLLHLHSLCALMSQHALMMSQYFNALFLTPTSFQVFYPRFEHTPFTLSLEYAQFKEMMSSIMILCQLEGHFNEALQSYPNQDSRGYSSSLIEENSSTQKEELHHYYFSSLPSWEPVPTRLQNLIG